LIKERIHQHRNTLDAKVTLRTTEVRDSFDKELAACKAAFQVELDNTKQQIKRSCNADIDAARLEAHELLAQETGRLRHEHKVKTQQICDDLNTHTLTSVA
jgi:mRNA-degrading endonuclease toxin of MazEF toxin-antitoxin module